MGLAAIAATGCGTPGSASPRPNPRVVATVGDRSISQALFDLRLNGTLRVISQSGGDASGHGRDAMVGRLRERVLRGLIIDTLIAAEAGFHHLEATDRDVEAGIDADRRAAGGDQALSKQLADAGSSMDQLRDEERSRLDEQRLEDYFARARAGDAEAALAGGTDFATVATQYSDDDASRARGGDAGTVPLDQLGSGDPALGRAVLGLAPGVVTTPPVRDRSGYDILRLDQVTPTARSFHRILVAAPDPYTIQGRPAWFTASIIAALDDDCGRGAVHVLITDAGPSPCLPPSPSPSGPAPTPSHGVPSPARPRG